MRAMKFCLLTAVILALSSPAWALLDHNTAPGPTIFKTGNWECGTIYWGTAGTYYYDDTDDRWEDGSGNPVAGTDLFMAGPANPLDGDENTWGGFIVYQMFSGTAGTLSDGTPWVYQASSLQYWNSSAQQSLYGFYWGGHDYEVTIKTTQYDPTATGFDPFAFNTKAEDIQVRAYLKDAAPPPLPTSYGGQDDVTRVTDDTDPRYGEFSEWNVSGATVILEGEIGDLVFVGGPVSGHPGSVGYTDLYVNVTGGTWDEWDTGYFGTDKDIQMHWILGPTEPQNDDNPWLLSEDTGRAVPEPATAVALFLAIGGLGTYIRKRAAA